jgi:transcriptional regulator with XRE-family HTH domain
VAEQAQVSVGMLSLIETGKRRPSLKSWGRIRQRLGITEPLPEEAWRQQPREISDELVASLRLPGRRARRYPGRAGRGGQRIAL